MKILAIETAAEACSAALYLDGEVQLKYRVEPRRHSELILPMMDQLLAEGGMSLSALDALAFANGPGAFTGIRIATGVVQGAAFAADLPVIAVSTLASLAQRAYREHGYRQTMSAFDARMGEVYWGCYLVDDANACVRALINDQLAFPEAVALPDGTGWYGVGSGWGSYADELSHRAGSRLSGRLPDLYCSAHDVADLAAAVPRSQWLSADRALPLYLRDKVANKPSTGQQGAS